MNVYIAMENHHAIHGKIQQCEVRSSLNIQIAMENGPVEIVDFPINSMAIFHGKMLVHQRVLGVLVPGVQ